MLDIDWDRVAARLKRHGLSHDQAWSAIGRTYITACEGNIASVNEAQFSEYVFQTALHWHLCWTIRPTLVELAVASKDNELSKRKSDDGREIAEDELFVQPEQTPSDTDYISELLKLVPLEMRIPTLVVLQQVLKRQPTKPLSVESCRKILQKAGVTNTSEYARQVYTFLTTFRSNHA